MLKQLKVTVLNFLFIGLGFSNQLFADTEEGFYEAFIEEYFPKYSGEIDIKSVRQTSIEDLYIL